MRHTTSLEPVHASNWLTEQTYLRVCSTTIVAIKCDGKTFAIDLQMSTNPTSLFSDEIMEWLQDDEEELDSLFEVAFKQCYMVNHVQAIPNHNYLKTHRPVLKPGLTATNRIHSCHS